jgi:hypothetical protein
VPLCRYEIAHGSKYQSSVATSIPATKPWARWIRGGHFILSSYRLTVSCNRSSSVSSRCSAPSFRIWTPSIRSLEPTLGSAARRLIEKNDYVKARPQSGGYASVPQHIHSLITWGDAAALTFSSTRAQVFVVTFPLCLSYRVVSRHRHPTRHEHDRNPDCGRRAIGDLKTQLPHLRQSGHERHRGT